MPFKSQSTKFGYMRNMGAGTFWCLLPSVFIALCKRTAMNLVSIAAYPRKFPCCPVYRGTKSDLPSLWATRKRKKKAQPTLSENSNEMNSVRGVCNCKIVPMLIKVVCLGLTEQQYEFGHCCSLARKVLSQDVSLMLVSGHIRSKSIWTSHSLIVVFSFL